MNAWANALESCAARRGFSSETVRRMMLAFSSASALTWSSRSETGSRSLSRRRTFSATASERASSTLVAASRSGSPAERSTCSAASDSRDVPNITRELLS